MLDQMSGSVTHQQKLPATEEQIIEFLKEHNELEMILPVLLGVIVTSRFQLRGAYALLVNLAIAAIFNQIFINLKKLDPSATAISARATTITPEPDTNSKYTIVHSVPGRIRLKIPQLKEDPDFATRCQQLLHQDSHVIHVRVNRAAASIVINYHSQGLSDFDLGLRLLSIMNQAEREE